MIIYIWSLDNEKTYIADICVIEDKDHLAYVAYAMAAGDLATAVARHQWVNRVDNID